MNKEEQSFRLFEQIGEIDESILRECSTLYPAVRRRKKTKVRLLILAAALALVFSVLTVFIGAAAVRGVRAVFGRNAKSDASFEASNHEVKKGLAEDDLRPLLFSGRPVIVYKSAASNLYTAVDLSPSDYRRIDEGGASSPAGAAEGDLPEGSLQVWVCDGSGIVFSPYLRKSAGNIYNGSVFDYEPEILPAPSVQTILNDYIRN